MLEARVMETSSFVPHKIMRDRIKGRHKEAGVTTEKFRMSISGTR